jgi:ABC-type multidrug transport system permease subunit
MVILPENFTSSYFGSPGPTEKVVFVRNAKQSILPGIVEDLFSIFTDGFSTVKLNAPGNLMDIREKIINIEGRENVNAEDLRPIANALGMNLVSEEPYFEPLIQKKYREAQEKQKVNARASLFANLFTGMSAFFLLFLADNAASDIFKEFSRRTLHRFRTMRFYLTALLFSKGISAVAIVFISALILFGAGGLIFDVPWTNPVPLIILCFSFAVFAAGLMTFLTNWAASSAVSGTLNPILIMLIGFLGGGMMPVRNLPEFIRENISPMFPNYWFYQAMIDVQLGRESDWLLTSAQLFGAGFLLATIAAIMMDRRLSKGVR